MFLIRFVFVRIIRLKNAENKKFPKNNAETRLQSFRVPILLAYNLIDLCLYQFNIPQNYEIFAINIFGTNFDYN